MNTQSLNILIFRLFFFDIFTLRYFILRHIYTLIFYPSIFLHFDILYFDIFTLRHFYTSTFYFRHFSFDLFTFDIFTFDLSWENRRGQNKHDSFFNFRSSEAYILTCQSSHKNGCGWLRSFFCPEKMSVFCIKIKLTETSNSIAKCFSIRIHTSSSKLSKFEHKKPDSIGRIKWTTASVSPTGVDLSILYC